MESIPSEMAQMLGFHYDFLRVSVILTLAIIVGWQMPPRLRYYRISNNALLVLVLGVAIATFAHYFSLGTASFEVIIATIIRLNFGTILTLYIMAWAAIFVINALRRRISNKNKARFIFKR